MARQLNKVFLTFLAARRMELCQGGICQGGVSIGDRSAHLFSFAIGSICDGDTPGTQNVPVLPMQTGAIENLLGSPTKAAGRYSQPRSPNAERSTPGGAYHPVEP